MSAFTNHLLIEFEYGSTHRPVDTGINTDERELAVQFSRITFVCATTNETLEDFDFQGRSPANAHVIYGLDAPEGCGCWSLGPRTAILFSLSKPVSGGFKIEITHDLVPTFPNNLAYVRINKGDEQILLFDGRLSTLELALPSPTNDRLLNSRLVSDTEQPIISVIILNFERPDLVFAAVASVLASSIQSPFEIIVIDNASTQDAYESLAKMNLPVRLIRLGDKRSFGAANNIGAERARGDFLLLLNNDAFLTEGVVEKLLAEASDEAVGIVGPVFRYPNGSLQEMGGFVDVIGNTTSTLHNGLNWDSPDLQDVDYISAACWIVRRGDFLEFGGFDPEFEDAYFEDVDLCLRFRAMGKSTRLVKSAIVYHILGASNPQPERETARKTTYTRNSSVLRSRWGRWLITRDKADAPVCDLLNQDRLRPQIAQFPMEPLNCLIAEGPLETGAKTRSMISRAVALSHLRPTMIVTRTPYAVVDVCKRASSLDLSHDRLTAGDFSDLENRNIDVVVLSACTFPVAPPSLGRQRILHCPFPVIPENMDVETLRRRVGGLLNFDAIVTDSEFSRRACLEILERLDAPPIDIEVIPIDANDLAAIDAPVEKQNIVVSMGPLRPGPAGGGHEIALRVFRDFFAAMRESRWRLVIAGDLALGDVGYADALRKIAPPFDLDVLINPSRATVRRLLSRSKIFLSVQGLALGPAEGPSQCSYSSQDVAIASSAGCVPIVFERGAEAEFCEIEGVGLCFYDETEILARLQEAAGMAASGVSTSLERMGADGFREAPQRDTWSNFISRTRMSSKSPVNKVEERDGSTLEPVAVPALVVVGMHRSGTSAMARSLSIAGGDLPSDLMAPQADNPAGFWEPVTIVELNDKIFAALDTSWDDLEIFSVQSRFEDREDIYLGLAIAHLKACYVGNRPIVLKDPRISVLIPFWDKALRAAGYEPNYVVMVRDPREVAASLGVRNKFSKGKGLLLWSSYMLCAERDSRNSRRVFVTYQDLIANPSVVIDTVQSKLGVELAKGGSAGRRLAEFVSDGFRNHSIDEPWSGLQIEPIRDYYYALLKLSRDGGAVGDTHEILDYWLRDLYESILKGFCVS